MPRFLCTMRLAILAVALTTILPRVGWAQPDCNYVGVSSYAGDGTHVLTNAVNGQVGVVWFNEQLDLSSPVSLSMEVYLGNQDATGADGIAFVISTSFACFSKSISWSNSFIRFWLIVVFSLSVTAEFSMIAMCFLKHLISFKTRSEDLDVEPISHHH